MAKKQAESKSQGYELSSCQVHQPATVKNATESNFRAVKGYKMLYTTEGVFVEYQDIEFIVPLANVIIAVLK